MTPPSHSTLTRFLRNGTQDLPPFVAAGYTTIRRRWPCPIAVRSLSAPLPLSSSYLRIPSLTCLCVSRIKSKQISQRPSPGPCAPPGPPTPLIPDELAGLLPYCITTFVGPRYFSILAKIAHNTISHYSERPRPLVSGSPSPEQDAADTYTGIRIDRPLACSSAWHFGHYYGPRASILLRIDRATFMMMRCQSIERLK